MDEPPGGNLEMKFYIKLNFWTNTASRVRTRLSIISIFSNLASFWECMVLKWYDWAPCICGIHANTKILWPLDRESNAQPNINQKVDHCTWGWFWWVSKNNNWSEIPVHWLFTKIKKKLFSLLRIINSLLLSIGYNSMCVSVTNYLAATRIVTHGGR